MMQIYLQIKIILLFENIKELFCDIINLMNLLMRLIKYRYLDSTIFLCCFFLFGGAFFESGKYW